MDPLLKDLLGLPSSARFSSLTFHSRPSYPGPSVSGTARAAFCHRPFGLAVSSPWNLALSPHELGTEMIYSGNLHSPRPDQVPRIYPLLLPSFPLLYCCGGHENALSNLVLRGALLPGTPSCWTLNPPPSVSEATLSSRNTKAGPFLRTGDLSRRQDFLRTTPQSKMTPLSPSQKHFSLCRVSRLLWLPPYFHTPTPKISWLFSLISVSIS